MASVASQDSISTLSCLCEHCKELLQHQLQALAAGKLASLKLKGIHQNFIDRDTQPCALCAYVWSLVIIEDESRIDHGVSTASTRQSEVKDPLDEHDRPSGILTFQDFDLLGHVRLELIARLEDSTSNTDIWRSPKPPEASERLPLARKWLDECREHHDHCIQRKRQMQQWNPSRLINVATSPPKLVSVQEHEHVAYAALSHCWGQHQPLRTLKSNIRHHEKELDLLDMPKTFQDAITATRSLELRYIWIDSLCIIQDDSADWESEAAKMADIYRHADITIAAAWGKDGTAGCFHDYRPPLVIEDADETECPSRVYLRPVPRIEHFVVDAPLNTRKWVLQENLLSLRILSFGEDQMYWACPAGRTMEDGLEHTFVNGLTPEERQEHDQNVEPEESLWARGVHRYSLCNLTFAKDKMAAFAGITKAYEASLGESVLGLWRQHLGKNLLWRAVGHAQLDVSAIANLKLPSWSWYKIVGEVSFSSSYNSEISGFNVQQIVVSWSGQALTSQLKCADLICSGMLVRIGKIHAPDDADCMCYSFGVHLRFANSAGRSKKLHAWPWSLDECVTRLEHDLYCLFMPDKKIFDAWLEAYPTMVDALILKRESRRESALPAYSRLGVTTFHTLPRGVYNMAEEQTFLFV